MNDPEQQRRLITRVTLWGSLINLGLSGVKVLAGLALSSQALVADGIHSLSDLITDAAILLGAPFWTAPPDAKHPYGHGRIETLVKGFIGATLGLVAVGLAWKAISSMGEAPPPPPGLPVLLIALFSIFCKEILYRWTRNAAQEAHSSALAANAWHHRSDALSSVPVALAGLVGLVAPQIRYLDHLAALLVSAMLLKVSLGILRPVLEEVLEARLEAGLEVALCKETEAFLPQARVGKLQLRRLGAALLADLDLLVAPQMSVREAHDQAEELLAHLRKLHPDLCEVQIHLEPLEEPATSTPPAPQSEDLRGGA